jgi:PAS domain S-box-containing protein
LSHTAANVQSVEHLIEERQVLRNLIDLLPDGIYIKDTESRFIVANATVARLMGVTTPDKLLGKTDFDFFPHDLASSYFEDEQSIIRTGLPLINREERTFDFRTGADGWLLTSKVLWRNYQGQVAGIVGIGRNITELKQAQEALAQAHHDLEYRVEFRTLELSHSKAKLERTITRLQSHLSQLTYMVQRDEPKPELLMYLGQAQRQFTLNQTGILPPHPIEQIELHEH